MDLRPTGTLAVVLALVLCLTATLCSSLENKRIGGSVIPDDDGGYAIIDEENGSQMFWWIQGYENVDKRDHAPLIIWLQGGPGASSVLGDLCEIGKIDACDGKAKPRAYSWNKLANLLFFDSPVGTGFSFTKKDAGYANSDEEVGKQLLVALKQVIAKYPVLASMPLYIFSESYGGKMNSYFAIEIAKAIQSGTLNINFKGVALGDSWISPADSVASYGTYLETLSHLTPQEAQKSDAFAEQIIKALNEKNYQKASSLWGEQQNYLESVTAYANIYNVLLHSQYDYTNMTKYVNNEFKKHYNIPDTVQWKMGSWEVFNHLDVSFMQPCIQNIDYLLKNNYQVIVYSGQLDIIVDTLGTNMWMSKLEWPELNHFNNMSKTVIRSSSALRNSQSNTLEKIKKALVKEKIPPIPYFYMFAPNENLHGEDSNHENEFDSANHHSSQNFVDPPIIDSRHLAFRQRYKNLDYWRILYGGHMLPMDNPVMSFEMVKRILSEQ